MPIESFTAFQFTVDNADECCALANAVITRDDPKDPRTWQLVLLAFANKVQLANIGDWIVARSGFFRAYSPEEFHRQFQIISYPARQ